jgi:MinD-like ATPase involved in chromosome partitioning or flagellar assembly
VLIINKVLSTMNFETLKSQVEKTYSAPVAAMFPLSEDMAQLASSGVFCLEYPYHVFTKKILALAAHIMA